MRGWLRFTVAALVAAALCGAGLGESQISSDGADGTMASDGSPVGLGDQSIGKHASSQTVCPGYPAAPLLLYRAIDDTTSLHNDVITSIANTGSVSGGDFAEVQASDDPLFRKPCLGTRPCWSFDGGNDNLLTSAFTAIAAPFTICATVLKQSTNTGVLLGDTVQAQNIIFSGASWIGRNGGVSLTDGAVTTNKVEQVCFHATASGASSKTCVNGSCTTGTTGTGSLSRLRMGEAHSSATFRFDGYVAELGVWDGDVVADYWDYSTSCYGAAGSDPVTATTTVTALGDSITAGQVGDVAFPTRLQQLLGAEYAVTNAGVSGEKCDQILTRWDASVRATAPDILVLMCGANDDINNEAAASTYAEISEMIGDQVTTDGRNAVLVGRTPWGSNINWSSTKQAKTDALEALIQADTTADGVVAVYASLEDPSNADELNPAYNTSALDGLHPDTDGNAVLAARIFAVMQSAGLAASDGSP